MSNKLLIHLVCDYQWSGDLAWAEMVSALFEEVSDSVDANDVWLHKTTATSFNTTSTGFLVAQIAGRKFKDPQKCIVFGNSAPRRDAAIPRLNNEGEGLLYAKLQNGVRLLVVNSGYSLSFIKSAIAELWSTRAESAGSQFRSRDFFPQLVGMLARNDLSFLEHKLKPEDVVPDSPASVVGYVDSFGNLKTTLRDGDKEIKGLKDGMRIELRIGTVVRMATVSSGSFGVQEGELAFAPGSSGYERRYWEVFQRGGSAYREFRRPDPGAAIELKVL
jgi:hypothetical protein